MRYLTAPEADPDSILCLQAQHRLPMIAPDPLPFHHEPGSELSTPVSGQLAGEAFRADPPPGRNLVVVHADTVRTAPYIHRTELVLSPIGVELCLIFEFEQKLQIAGHPEFFKQPPAGGGLQGLAATRMAAAAIRPIEWPETFARRALLDQQFAVAVENQERKGPMQDSAAFVAADFAERPHAVIGGINEDQSVGICGNIPLIATMTALNLIHDCYLNPPGSA
jgi:hypothetical protein